MNARPLRLLIFSIDTSFLGLARLPKALSLAGFEVAALCPENAFLSKTRYLNLHFPLATTKNASKLLKQLVNTVQKWQPDMLIYGDETTVAFVHYIIHNLEKFISIIPNTILNLLKSSLGNPQFFAATLRKHLTLELASELGLRTPAIARVATPEQALQFVEANGYPVVLKKDFCWSGVGVKVCRNESELLSAIKDFQPHPPSLPKSFAKKFLQQDWFPTTEVLSVQQFIQGKTAMHPIVTLDGEVLAGFVAIKELTCSETGPSSLIRLTNHAEMRATVLKLAKHFQYSGFASFDFLIDENTNYAYLVECNPRPVPICHLGARVSVDLCQALFNRLSGKSLEPQLTVQQEELVALFPQEWRRDRNSPYLHQVYHDVPWDDTSLLQAYLTQM
ncbi:ATP-binding protein [Calothrix sp. NIES-2098]|uniref:ATP-binding protein n=1 Tax=Calothrix sp. NIES-2098 TaxID=1954171 RepID=UPI000B61844A|nr:urea carboxylase [Calothrix sp. NIES-2098]